MNDLEIYLYKTSSNTLDSTWKRWGTINSKITGKYKNHNPCWIRQPNGDIYAESSTLYKYINFGLGDSSPSTWDIGQARLVDGWEFNVEGNKEGWVAYNVSLDSGPWSNGLWIVTACCNDPMWVSPKIAVDAADFKRVKVKMASQNSNTLGQVFFKTSAEDFYSEDKSVTFTVINDGGWYEYTVDLGTKSKYTGTITGIRVDPIGAGNGKPLGIDYIRIAP